MLEQEPTTNEEVSEIIRKGENGESVPIVGEEAEDEDDEYDDDYIGPDGGDPDGRGYDEGKGYDAEENEDNDD